MKISFAIPLYNAEKTIAKTLESLSKVEYEDYEVILVDDCSTDSSLEIAKNYNCKILQISQKTGAVDAIVCILSKDNPCPNFSSRYKNLHMLFLNWENAWIYFINLYFSNCCPERNL